MENRTLKKIQVEELIPYENNPRINDGAVDAVIESIKQCGYVAPIVVDEDYVILAGHTRRKALMDMGVDEVECIVLEGLTEEQKKKYRLYDNKTNELAEWDEELLNGELECLNLDNFTWFDEPEPIVATDAGKKEKAEHQSVYCPRCGSLVKE